ncbi:MAG TPA: DUF4238 domain-containing protein [Paludibacter sp.]
MKQDQHIIPQVYLKQFGYQDENGIWKVPTYNIDEIKLMNKIDKTLIRQSNIKSLLQERNIYDIPTNDENKSDLEGFLKLTEDNYPQIIEEIKMGNTLSIHNRKMLLGFISLLFVRTKDYRKILNAVIENKDYIYLNGILDGNKRRIETILTLPIESAINFLIAFSGGYIFKCLLNFKVSIIKTISTEKWSTTDNPVLAIVKTDDQNRFDFMGVNTKMMCPLSPDYLAYIDHKDSNIQLFPNFEKLVENRVNKIDNDTFEKIWYKLTDISRITKYLIAPTERKYK